MKRIKCSSLIFLILLIFLVNVTTKAENIINKNNLQFSIKPNNLNYNSYLILAEVEKELGLNSIILNNNSLLIIDSGKNYFIEVGNNMVKIENDYKELEKDIKKINNHILIPEEFLIDILNVNFKSDKVRDKINEELEIKVDIEHTNKNNDYLFDISIKLVTNNKEQVLEFNTNQVFDIYIRNKANKIIYKWSNEKKFSQVFKRIRISEMDAFAINEQFLVKDIKKGDYYIEVKIKSINKDINKIIEKISL